MSAIQCQTTVVSIHNRLIIKLPASASAKLPSRGQVMVRADVNGHRFTTALEPDGKLSHWFQLDTSHQQTTGLKAGDAVELRVEVTKDWPEPALPADWQAVLDTDLQIAGLWQNITPMARWQWLRWINSTSNPATRQRRIEVSCSKLLKGQRRPCCFNRNMCCVPEVSKNGVLLQPTPLSG